jgi:RES domain-containing protein
LIRCWLLCQRIHQDKAFSGDGARHYGGRWNQKGQTAVYTAATLSLAALEILVHVDTDLVPNDYVAFAVDIPDDVAMETFADIVSETEYQTARFSLTCQKYGSEWLKNGRSAVLEVPSVIVPKEKNFILNPFHYHFSQLQIYPTEPFRFDNRLWT